MQSLMSNSYDLETYKEINDTLLYLDYLNNNYEYQTITVTPDVAYRYQGNLFGLFKDINISAEYHVYAMYVNGFTNPMQFKGDIMTFKLPNFGIIEYLKKLN